jgi:type IV pilus assembly protein PilA
VLRALQRRLQGEREGGFTLIELMVVVLIIAILIAIAIPTFLGARQRAQDRAAQSNLRNALTAEKSYYTDKQSYTQTQSELTAIEPSLTFDAAADTALSAGSISYSATTTGGGTVILGTKSASSTCFYVKDVVSTGTTYAKDTACAKPSATTATFSSTGWQ